MLGQATVVITFAQQALACQLRRFVSESIKRYCASFFMFRLNNYTGVCFNATNASTLSTRTVDENRTIAADK
jgi:hypothetical protein